MSPTRIGTARLVAVLATILALIGAPAARAAGVPVNDHWDHAAALTVGKTVVLNTTAATTDRVDARANERCGAPFTRASVWYTFKPARTGRFLLDMTKSDYSGGFMLFRGRPSAASLINCGPGQVGFRGIAGVRYYAVAFSDTRRNGGRLVLSLSRVLPPTLTVTIDPQASATKDGAAIVTGSVTCTNGTLAFMEGRLEQALGRIKIVGYGYAEEGPACDGTARSFSLVMTSETGRFGGGKALMDLYVVACNSFECKERSLVAVEISLRRGTG